MGLLNWMMKGFGDNWPRFSRSQQPHVPTFEQLEPRLLLSADASFVPDFQLLHTFEEQVISVDIHQGSGIGDQGSVASGEWLVASGECHSPLITRHCYST